MSTHQIDWATARVELTQRPAEWSSGNAPTTFTLWVRLKGETTISWLYAFHGLANAQLSGGPNPWGWIGVLGDEIVVQDLIRDLSQVPPRWEAHFLLRLYQHLTLVVYETDRKSGSEPMEVSEQLRQMGDRLAGVRISADRETDPEQLAREIGEHLRAHS
jgi:hypothetical protein